MKKNTKMLPLIEGTLWWIGYPDFTEKQLINEIQAQKDVGFDIIWTTGSNILLKSAINNEKSGKEYDLLEKMYSIANGEGASRPSMRAPFCQVLKWTRTDVSWKAITPMGNGVLTIW